MNNQQADESSKSQYRVGIRYNPLEIEDTQNISIAIFGARRILDEWRDYQHSQKLHNQELLSEYEVLSGTVKRLQTNIDLQNDILKRQTTDTPEEWNVHVEELKHRAHEIIADLEALTTDLSKFYLPENNE